MGEGAMEEGTAEESVPGTVLENIGRVDGVIVQKWFVLEGLDDIYDQTDEHNRARNNRDGA